MSSDGFLLGDEALAIADRKVSSGEWEVNWVREVRELGVYNFSRWRDAPAHVSAQEALVGEVTRIHRSEGRRRGLSTAPPKDRASNRASERASNRASNHASDRASNRASDRAS